MFKYLLRKLKFYLSETVGMAGLRGDQVDAYRKDMYKFEREGALEKDVMYPKIYKVVQGATGAGTKDTQQLSAGPLTRHTAEGQTITFKSPVEGWTTYGAYHTYSDGLTFSPEAIEDTVKLGNMLNDLAKTWGVEVRVSKETLASRAFNNGGDLLGDSVVFNGSYTGETDPSGNLLYDGYPFFNLTGNARSTKGGGTYYNSVAAAYGTPITSSHFETLYNLMTSTNNRDEQDRVISNKPDTVLSKPGAANLALKRVLLSERLAGGELNDINVYQGLVKNIYDWDYLDESAFYVGKAQHEAVQFHERLAPQIRFFRDEDTAGYKASIRTRFGTYFKVGSWRAWVRGGGTSA
jgi:hypothetical protein